MNKFYTIKKEATFELIEKKSKFITNLFYIKTKEEAIQKLESIKKLYPDAKHHVFAYRLIENDKKIYEKFSEDGEPAGTAGLPLLNLLTQNNLVNVLIIVTRYFGGILLGTGGLFKAYSDSGKNVILNSKIDEIKEVYSLKVEIDYTLLNKLKHYIQSNNFLIEKEEFSTNVSIIVLVPVNMYEQFLYYLVELTNKQSKVSIISKNFS